MLLASEVHARELLVERDRDVWVRLVVAKPDVVAGPVLADEVLFGQQGLGLRLRGDELDVLDLVDQAMRALGRRAREVRRHPLPDRLRLSDVQHPATRVTEEVDAGRVRKRAPLSADPIGSLVLGRRGGCRGHLRQ